MITSCKVPGTPFPHVIDVTLTAESLGFRFSNSLPRDLKRATEVGITVIPALLRGLLIRISVPADRAIVDASLDSDRFDGIFLNGRIPSDARALFETVLCLVQFFSDFFSESVPRHVSYQTINWPAVAKK
jgi:hypothetical protein